MDVGESELTKWWQSNNDMIRFWNLGPHGKKLLDLPAFSTPAFSAPPNYMVYGDPEWPWNIFSATANLSMASDTERAIFLR